MRHGAALALLLLALLAAPCARAVPPPAALVPRRALAQAPGPQPQPLEAQIIRPEQAYKTPAKDLVAVPSTAVDVPPLNVTAARAPTIEDCSARCRQAPGCQWFWYCSSAEGCWDGADSTVAYQQCVLRGQGVKAQCRLPPLARSSSSQELVTSGELAATAPHAACKRAQACRPHAGPGACGRATACALCSPTRRPPERPRRRARPLR